MSGSMEGIMGVQREMKGLNKATGSMEGKHKEDPRRLLDPWRENTKRIQGDYWIHGGKIRRGSKETKAAAAADQ